MFNINGSICGIFLVLSIVNFSGLLAHLPLQSSSIPGSSTILSWKRDLVGHTGMIRSLAFSTNNILASGSDDRTIKLWSTTNWKLLRTIIIVDTATSQNGKVSSVAFTKNNTLVAGFIDWHVRLYNSETGKVIRTHDAFGKVFSMAVSSADIIAAGTFGNILLWSFETGQLLKRFTAHDGERIRCLAFSEKNVLASGSGNLIKLWDAKTWELIANLEGHTDQVVGVAFNLNSMLASISLDKSVKLWNSDTGDLIDTLKSGIVNNAIVFGRDGVLLTGGTHTTMKWWNSNTGDLMKTTVNNANNSYSFFALSANNVYAGSESNLIHMYE